jgi:hypothetical protein
MLAKQYSHRLPAGFDMSLIRQRAARRGALWDAAEGLAFKAFVARERGRDGALANVYASVYLWLDVRSAADFVMDERFQNVIDGFGRPAIETWLPLEARVGPARQALTLYREDIPVEEGADRAALRVAERQRVGDAVENADTVAAVSAIDVQHWRLVRLTLSSSAPDGGRPGTAYEVLHLSRPGLAALG